MVDIKNLNMEKIKHDDYLDYEEKLLKKGGGKRKKKEKGPLTKSEKQGHKQEVLQERLKRAKEAEKMIAKHLSSSFKHLKTDQGQKQIQDYIEWVKESLELKTPWLNWEEEVRVYSFVSSVKAGGQQRQRTKSGVRLIHLPTSISVKNENERSFEQNKQKAKLALVDRLKEHLSLWQTLEENSPGKINIKGILQL